ncbi:FtsX-like permease family protein [Youhaiella tibetensis]|uniref:FtsX-like permease family protein n=1 Tax=Paradevosia tibetensis TaxID=1447062 RepID=A0A5B9DKM0_9HYPH|nr:ABC transporter permease [Youhaiella tibetensis]QEE19790.1 FtsX-like permease family protein [Youhaiella tibetensis]
MSALHRKLLRDAARLWAQVLAISLVLAAGVATLIVGTGAYASLAQTRDAYYRSSSFADIFANVTRAPNALNEQIRSIPGVRGSETRIVEAALADVPGMSQPASVELISLPDLGAQSLNKVHVRRGRLPAKDSHDEAAVSERFAMAHDMQIGDKLSVVANGRWREIRVTGIVLSPEFIYAIGPGDIFPDDRRFGVLWMSESMMAAAYDMQDAFSSVLVDVTPGVDTRRVIERIDTLLKPFGTQGAYGRDQQISYRFLYAELRQLQAMSWVLPPIFLAVAAFLVGMTLSRLVTLEREQVGLLKALGYGKWAVARHYVEFAIIVGIVGLVIGLGAGVVLGQRLTRLYAQYYSFPFLSFSGDARIYVLAAFASIGAVVIGAGRSALAVASLPPSVAMLPQPPSRYSRTFGTNTPALASGGMALVMVIRHLVHSPLRTAGAVMGVVLATAVLVASLWSFGSTDFLIDFTFFKAQRQSATVTFGKPLPPSAALDLARLPGVSRVEPIRVVPAVLRNGIHERRVAVEGRVAGADLSRSLDTELRPVEAPGSGLMLSSALAAALAVAPGDTVELEPLIGVRESKLVPVVSVVESYIGLGATMRLEALERLLGGAVTIGGADIRLDPSREDAFFASVKHVPTVASVSLLRLALTKFRETLAQNVLVMVAIYVGFAGIIAFGVIYNFARISLSEQGRELASLRVLGFSSREVAAVLYRELAIILLVSQPIGWLLGYGLGSAVARGFSTELYRIPLIIGPDVYAWASICVVGSGLLSFVLIGRRIRRLDLIAVLKTRE